MLLNWKFFLGATILSCGLLFKVGAPVLPVAAGVAAAAFVSWRARRRT